MLTLHTIPVSLKMLFAVTLLAAGSANAAERSGEAAPAPAELLAMNTGVPVGISPAASAVTTRAVTIGSALISSPVSGSAKISPAALGFMPVHVSVSQPSLSKAAESLTLPAHPVASSENLLRELPVIGTVRRRVGDRFNTTESSRIDAFAVCYHVSDRVGLQVIPGNPGPPRMGASYIANNAGVTVGMTLRLQRQR